MIERALRNATLYEVVQTVTGAHISEAKVREILGTIPTEGHLLDAGGGTGIMARLFNLGPDYFCMDLELDRVQVARRRGSSAVVGDVTAMPVASASIDLVIQRAVSHHLTDAEFASMVTESFRVLKPGGRLLFLDAIWAPSRIPGRLLWRLDQGSHPRTEARMRDVLETCFVIERSLSYAVYHRYYLALARRREDEGRKDGPTAGRQQAGS